MTDDRTMRRSRIALRLVLLLPMLAWGAGAASSARADNEIAQALIDGGRVRYGQYCTPCHGPGGAPGTASVDLRTYVARHGGKFPEADWLAVLANARPGSVHDDVWNRIKRDYGAIDNAGAAARGTMAQIARYVMSIQTK